MRIVHVIDSLERGGAENLVVGLAHEMSRLGHDVAIITMNGRNDFVALTEKYRLSVYSCGFTASIRSLPAVWDAIRKMRTLIARLRPDVINTHIFMSDIVTRAVAGRSVPIVTTFHTNEEWWSKPRGFIKYAKRFVESISARLITVRFIAVSQKSADEAATFLRIDRNRCHVISNGVDTGMFSPGQNALQRIAIIQVARFYPEKNHETSLQAFRLLLKQEPAAELWLVGDGPIKAHIESMAEALGISAQVRFLGLRDDVDVLLPQCRLFWLTSRREGLPISLLEAMAAGVVPIVTAVGDIPSVIEHGPSGFLADVGDHESIARLTCVLLRDEAARQKMAANARATVEQRYSIAETARHYLDVYSQVSRVA